MSLLQYRLCTHHRHLCNCDLPTIFRPFQHVMAYLRTKFARPVSSDLLASRRLQTCILIGRSIVAVNPRAVLDVLQSASLLSLPRIEPGFIGCPGRSVATIPTKPARFRELLCVHFQICYYSDPTSACLVWVRCKMRQQSVQVACCSRARA